jgi:CCR4-NOT transcription complex subunit 3
MNLENDKGSSQDNQSIQDDIAEPESRPSVPPAKQRAAAEAAGGSTGRRPSTQLKSPLPTLATVHSNPLPTISNGAPANVAMKPASVPTRPEGLRYANAAAAAVEKNAFGIQPLPPPRSGTPGAGIASLPTAQPKASVTASPNNVAIQPVTQERTPSTVPPATTNTPSLAAAAPVSSGKADNRATS